MARVLRHDRESGQSLVEFALAFPLFVFLLMATIEFGFLWNNVLTIQFASRQGVSAAAQVGGEDGADCAILKAVENALTVPIDRTQITAVEIFQSDANGDPIPGRINRYVRTGPLDCPGTASQPYVLVGTEGYPQAARKDTLAEGLEVVGVRIEYEYRAITPFAAGRTWEVSDGATLRIEPKQ
ncbi:MAG TPA: TadE family protein [Candidatus Limnocylindrales bacterium]